jgi:hypothetical protein
MHSTREANTEHIEEVPVPEGVNGRLQDVKNRGVGFAITKGDGFAKFEYGEMAGVEPRVGDWLGVRVVQMDGQGGRGRDASYLAPPAHLDAVYSGKADLMRAH